MLKLNEKTLNLLFNLGAAVVILGALFKITHWPLPFGISGNLILGIGLLFEAGIFFVSAFNPPATEEKYAWEKVYPELLDPNAQPKPRKVSPVVETSGLDVSLSEKLDKMLADAKLDVSLFERLKAGIDKFSNSVEEINTTVDVSTATRKYNDQLTLAASHLESMNALYALQLDHGKQQSEYHQKYVADLQKSAEQSDRFNQELQGLTNNLNNLNKVYGGMLNAMKG
ncbi:type IX secretion system motor protein PorL/GldL [Bergeyella sp. RCAD1439]|uniref:type IX secretion system motor protein PorL/GldL n=1 Tax=Bergeyella anatis TaxID=3113737 RepID=UPI002E19FCBA|nr:gliding motility protein GldL [Bergeyella sp. RCAD1439]